MTTLRNIIRFQVQGCLALIVSSLVLLIFFLAVVLGSVSGLLLIALFIALLLYKKSSTRPS